MDTMVRDVFMTVKGIRCKYRIICFLQSNSNRYVIYTLNELDQNDNITIYISKVIVGDKGLDGISITDENEWEIIRGYIKDVFTKNEVSAKKLDYSALINIDMSDYRKVKLPRKNTTSVLKDFTPLLMQMEKNEEIIESDKTPVIETNNKSQKTYKELYLKEKSLNDNLVEQINTLTTELNNYKLTIINIKKSMKNLKD